MLLGDEDITPSIESPLTIPNLIRHINDVLNSVMESKKETTVPTKVFVERVDIYMNNSRFLLNYKIIIPRDVNSTFFYFIIF